MIRNVIINIILITFVALLSGCKSSFLKLEKKDEDFAKNAEFDQQVVIKELPAEGAESSASVVVTPPLVAASVKDTAKKTVKKAPEKKAVKKAKPTKAELAKAEKEVQKKVQDAVAAETVPVATTASEEEDKEGMNGRRPVKDPFRVGEEVIHELHYFKVSAGELRLKVGPFVEVNGKKSYSFVTELESSGMFSSFYSVQDSATVYMDYMQFVPHVFSLSVKETGQIRDAKGLFDIQNNKATYWEKKFTKKNGHEETKKEWEILPFSQSVYSAAYYMRLFKWEVGKEYAFRVADAGENIMFRGKAIRKEKLETEVGDFDAIVIKPEITVKGVFKPIGDIYFWLSDDDRKYILRIESAIKIGTIVSEVVKIKPGN